jgi:hypothetical protein
MNVCSENGFILKGMSNQVTVIHHLSDQPYQPWGHHILSRTCTARLFVDSASSCEYYSVCQLCSHLRHCYSVEQSKKTDQPPDLAEELIPRAVPHTLYVSLHFIFPSLCKVGAILS